ncbi:MAG: metallophosphoesterase [Clostridia bacterium]|nr:metallophosphoesterase [Clostridia bacterium]
MTRFRLLSMSVLLLVMLPIFRCSPEKKARFISTRQTPLPVSVAVSEEPPTLVEPLLLVPGATAYKTVIPRATPSPTATAVPTPFSLYFVSDTQVYAYKYPKIFHAMFTYMANERNKLNALGVLMTGDIVDNRHLQRHWDNAQGALGLLDGRLPIWCVAGNHDVGADKAEYEKFLSYAFCTVQEAKKLYRDGVCWYDTLSAGGSTFLLLGLGWQVEDGFLPWAKEVLDGHPDLPVILLVHSFLTDKGGLTAMGKKVEEQLLSQCPHPYLVLCGHNDGSARWSIDYGPGHFVNAMMYNFQDDKKKGLGYLRILTFVPQNRSLEIVTYSPYLEDYNYYTDTDRDSFVLENAW